LLSAGEIFTKLGVRFYAEAARTATEKLANKKILTETKPEKQRSSPVVSQLLTVRLAEATASRELLFRELVAVLQQESKAKKIIMSPKRTNKKFCVRSSRTDIRIGRKRRFSRQTSGSRI
jgi:hypothetical protein